ncbi:MAG: hypothetical protein ACRCVJ_12990 [Clostridium sp.]|uniref:hypothetical protein n=1 Tax=Clostridium sp. TaxID=1506 RepID=UPI003F3270C2
MFERIKSIFKNKIDKSQKFTKDSAQKQKLLFDIDKDVEVSKSRINSIRKSIQNTKR